MQLPKSPLFHEMQWTQLADLPETSNISYIAIQIGYE